MNDNDELNNTFRNDGDDKTWDEICKLSQQHLFLTKPQLMQALLRDKYQELYDQVTTEIDAKVLKS